MRLRPKAPRPDAAADAPNPAAEPPATPPPGPADLQNPYRRFFTQTPRLEDLAIYPATRLTRRQIYEYFHTIKAKLSLYLTALHDEDLLQRPAGCQWVRFTLILAQYRHLHLHLGMLMGFVLAVTGLTPRTLELGEEIPTGPYDPYR